jgi:endonuclease/exonuclease/phosphatase (EEP) superfamily protein YafD
VNLLATHTAVRDSDAQLEAVLTLFESLTAPAVLAADLNARRDHPRLARTLATADDALAPADAAGDRIDWILVRGAPTSDAFVGLIHASDHPPVAVTIENPAQ